MNTRRDPERLIHAFLMEGRTELADQVYDAVRATIEDTHQRAVIGPWRLPTMNKFLPIGLGAAAVVAVLFLGSQFIGSPSSNVGGPASQPPASAVPSKAPASTPPSPISPPPLTESFTSTVHGISVSYPEGWTARAATEPLTDRPGIPQSVDPGFDVLQDPILTDHLFLYFASQPIGDTTPADWVAAHMASSGCTTTEPIAVDGATGLIGANACDTVAVTTAGRGYQISLLRSDDDPVLVAPYDRAWFEEVLATVQLQPEDAVDVVPSATP